MNIVSWILFGLLAGAVARLVVPGRHPIGCLPTLAVGIVGALIGGLIGEVVLGKKVRFGWDLGPFLLAVAGSGVLLLALQALSGRRRY
ncbi:MAG: GlsB/YeaQ/YmgE family stress response membrane protein [Actinomycetota bacterium]|nr:GlsB/YeaQ/YmgE family stress response membrane protein [Actinomycetota bacterium]